jgi:hypothetical protein
MDVKQALDAMNEVQTNVVTIPIPTGSTIKPDWPVAIQS